jgi:hypothetical protein
MNKLIKIHAGNKILKGKTLRHWSLMGFFICGVGLISSWVSLKIFLISKGYFPFNFTEYFLFAGFVLFWVGMKVMVSYIKVYENGIKVRDNSMIKYVRTRFIPFHQITNISLNEKRYPDLIIQLENEIIVVPTIAIKNYKEVVAEISKHID